MKIVLKHADYKCGGTVRCSGGVLSCSKCKQTSKFGPLACTSEMKLSDSDVPRHYTKRARRYRGR